MKQHGAFLDDLLEKRQVVAYAPVMARSSGYGLSLCQIADDQDIEAITSQDPMVKKRRSL